VFLEGVELKGGECIETPLHILHDPHVHDTIAVESDYYFLPTWKTKMKKQHRAKEGNREVVQMGDTVRLLTMWTLTLMTEKVVVVADDEGEGRVQRRSPIW